MSSISSKSYSWIDINKEMPIPGSRIIVSLDLPYVKNHKTIMICKVRGIKIPYWDNKEFTTHWMLCLELP